jgi:hypothetical protein
MIPPTENLWTLDTWLYLYYLYIFTSVHTCVQTVVDTWSTVQRAWTVSRTLSWTIQLFSFLSFAGNKNASVYCPDVFGGRRLGR